MECVKCTGKKYSKVNNMPSLTIIKILLHYPLNLATNTITVILESDWIFLEQAQLSSSQDVCLKFSNGDKAMHGAVLALSREVAKICH